jgi:serine/threonine-protein kinase RsbT
MMHFEYKLTGGDFTQAGKASSEVKKILKQLGVDHKIVKRTVIALYESEVNVAAHAHKGTISVDIEPEVIKINLKDEGPGIPNIPLAMTKGFSTASKAVREMGFGAGMGLPNIKENVDDFKISSVVGEGTTLELVNYIR